MTSAVAKRPSEKLTSTPPVAPQPESKPAGFDFAAEAELFPTRGTRTKRMPFAYRRFARASEAVRFAIEQLPSDALAGAYLEVRERRFDRNGIRQLYESDAYPLPRRKVTS